MREIKFRAWDKKNKQLRYDINIILDLKGNVYEVENLGDCLEFENVEENIELQQFAGLKDKNGKEIYEGDILKVYSNYMEKPEIYLVKWFGDKDYPAFDLENWESESNGLSELSQSGEYDYEVIGNIFENTDLIK
jgi:uncharacterized phage protein (TIGR01671 family)